MKHEELRILKASWDGPTIYFMGRVTFLDGVPIDFDDCPESDCVGEIREAAGKPPVNVDDIDVLPIDEMRKVTAEEWTAAKEAWATKMAARK